MSNRLSLQSTGWALAACLASAPAFAGVQSFVSTKGTDAGTCATITAPCRTFAYAHNQTSAGGEILALDAGDYSPVTITKSLSIAGAVDGAGVRGGAVNTAISINAGATGVVSLTGLTLDGLGTVNYGIGVGDTTFVIIKNCVIRNYAITGIFTFMNSRNFLIEDVSVAKTAAGYGIVAYGAGVVNRTSVSETGGIFGKVEGAVTTAFSPTISEATITKNTSGIVGNVRLNRSVLTGNSSGLVHLSDSAGDNFIRGNTTNLVVPPNVVGKQ